eukprot:m.99217 g.99217  ORF g.99217 m.99217 type:complete len:1565 (-) comp27137_c0_seq3:25-4719(-)
MSSLPATRRAHGGYQGSNGDGSSTFGRTTMSSIGSLVSNAPSGYALTEDNNASIASLSHSRQTARGYNDMDTDSELSGSRLSGSRMSDAPEYQHDDGEKPTWTTDKLTQTLEPRVLEEKSTRKYGCPQYMLIFVTGLILMLVFIANVASKLSFLTLAEKFKDSKNLDHQPTAHAALILMMMTIVLPQLMGFMQSVWSSCYKSGRNNPMPSTKSILWIVLAALLESCGMSIYVLLIVPRVPSVLCLVIMNGVFSVPALARCLSSRLITEKEKRGYADDSEEQPLLNTDNPTLDDIQVTQSPVGSSEKWALWTACLIQFGALIYVPLYMYFITADINADTAAMAAGAMLMMSVAWLPALQERTMAPSDPNHPMTARTKAGILSNVLKIMFTLTWMTLLLQNADEYTIADIGNGFAHLHNSELLVDFVIHIVSSHLGYHVARMACAMSLQVFGFALPLLLATPITVAMVMSSCLDTETEITNIFVVDCLQNTTDQYILIAIALTLWVSQNIIIARNAWNSRTPLLALDETLFYQSSYNSVLLEQYLLLNRRDPTPYSEVAVEDPNDPSIRVYICSTMYREAPHEMKQLLQSVMKVDVEVPNVFEWHIFVDGACNGNQLGQYAIQFVACLKEEVEKAIGVDEIHDWIENGQKIETPYGQRLEWILPYGTPLAVHFKDPTLVKSKKRWSQVMYMYYLLQFRVPREHPRDTSASYILTTDADIIFTPDDVQALVVLLSRDKRVGACCGRTYPKGSGPVYWYQIFDYAVGHWFQKTSEHVLGTVLCCPGCFSLYRIDALRDCLLQYSASVTEAFDFLTMDMGEDRWLCTLLIMKGWRLDYTAVATNTTFCPESFEEFFNQRRRWIVSTLANQVELLSHWREAVKNNDSMSYNFIIYQAAMVFSSLVSPATTILVVMGGATYSFESNLYDVMAWLFTAVAVYCLLLIFTDQKTQLFISKIYTGLFALLMGSVVVGMATQIADEFRLDCTREPLNISTTLPPQYVDPCDAQVFGRLSVTTIYLFGMISIFFVAAMLHTSEALDLFQGIWYLLCLPAGYLLLVVFAFVNLDDRSWGTRSATKRPVAGSSTKWIRTLLRGCGIWEDESVWHFFGRVISCRCHRDAPVEAEPHPYAMMSESEETKFDSKTWSLSEDGSKARCEPVEVLLAFITDHEADESLEPHAEDLRQLTAAALHACPSLLSWGQWTRCWHDPSSSFRIPRGAGTVSEAKFWKQMLSEISSHMEQNYSWSVTARQVDFQLPDGHMKIGQWLESIGLTDGYMVRIFVDNGYDDTTFVTKLTEPDLRDIGMPATLTGRAHIRKLLDSVNKLPRNTLPDSIPPTVSEWLDALCLGFYMSNFERCGYTDKDLALLEGLQLSDLQQMGIIKRGHLEKLLLAVGKLTKLLVQGRSPEGKSTALIKVGEIRDLISRLHEATLEETLFAPRLVLSDEESFWRQLVASKLDPKLESIANVNGLKQKLGSLRNVAIIVLFVVNTIWIVVILELSSSGTLALKVYGQNPLGFMFLIVYGSLFLIQFCSLLWHRMATAVQYVASIPFPAKTDDSEVKHIYAEIQAQ